MVQDNPEVVTGIEIPSPEIELTTKEGTTDEEDGEVSREDSEEYKNNPNVYANRHPPSLFTDELGNLKFVNLVCAHPFKVFWTILITCLTCTVILSVIVYRDGNPFVNGSQYDISDIRSTAYDSLRLAIDVVDVRRDNSKIGEEEERLEIIRPRENQLDSTFWLFESETSDGLFASEDTIRKMKAAFDIMLENAEYESYCQLDYGEDDGTDITSPNCSLPLTPLNMYYASKWDAELVRTVMDELMTDYPANVLRYNFLGVCVQFDTFCPPFIDDDDFEWAVALKDNITRISDKWDGKGELNSDIDQVTMFAALMTELPTYRGLIDFGFDKNFNLTNPKSFYSRGTIPWGGPLDDRDSSGTYNRTDRTVDRDILKKYIVDKLLKEMKITAAQSTDPDLNTFYFMGSLILEILFDIVQRDASLVLFSFLFVCIYIRIALGSWLLAFIGLLEIGLSIPVSWFVFSICFRIKYFSFLNTLALFIVAAIGADDIFIFMDAYKQSATPAPEDAHILNSLESRMSWVYRRTGSAMAITSATTCLAFLCTLLTPLDDVRAFGIFAALVIFVDYVLVMTMFCTAVVIYHNKFEKQRCCCPCKAKDPSPDAMALENVTSSSGEVKKDMISSFFGNKVSAFILNPISRFMIAVVFVSWLIAASIYATKLEPVQNAEQFLDENHSLQRSFDILSNEFSTAVSDEGLETFFAWGLGDVDRKGVNRLMDPEYFGAPVFLETFNFDEKCQVTMLQACDDLKTNLSYIPFIKQTDGLGTVKCFVEEFGAYSAIGNLDNCEAVKTGDWKQTNWTVPIDTFPSFMKEFLEQGSCYSGRNNTILSHYKTELGWDGTDLKYASINVENAVLDQYSSKAEFVVREQYDAMIQISQEFNTKMENICGSPVVMTDLNEKFTFMNNQRIYVQSALYSSLLGIGIAFVVLFLSTRLLHIALLATLSIACVLVSVIGVMAMIGWELGSTEAILISVVAGFSVDYVVHLAHSYEQAKGDTDQRIKTTFWEMGISVMNGMVTSVGASIPLFFCQLQFFAKFGTFLCTILAFSWGFANFAFMASLAQLKIPISEKRKVCGV